MTKEELINKIEDELGFFNESETKDLANISIKYAISVLEEYKKELPPIPGVERAHKKQIEEIKSLLIL